MANEPDNVVLQILKDIQSTLADHGRVLDDHSGRFDNIERELSDLAKLVTYSLGQSTETQFRQSQQERRIDELFERVSKLESERVE